MGRKIKVNWVEVRNLGKRTANNCEAFEKSRINMQQIIASTATCWQGTDSENFRTNANSYLESLKWHTESLDTWSRFFDKASLRYNNGVENGLTRVRNISKEYSSNGFRR